MRGQPPSPPLRGQRSFWKRKKRKRSIASDIVAEDGDGQVQLISLQPILATVEHCSSFTGRVRPKVSSSAELVTFSNRLLPLISASSPDLLPEEEDGNQEGRGEALRCCSLQYSSEGHLAGSQLFIPVVDQRKDQQSRSSGTDYSASHASLDDIEKTGETDADEAEEEDTNSGHPIYVNLLYFERALEKHYRIEKDQRPKEEEEAVREDDTYCCIRSSVEDSDYDEAEREEGERFVSSEEFSEISDDQSSLTMSEIEAIVASSDSFWEVGQYKRTVKRVEDGHKLCDELMKLMAERADIEKAYAKSLKAWAKKWNDSIGKGPEYGTMQASWMAFLHEADQRHDVQMTVRDRMMNEVYESVKKWQKETYHKSVMGFKESKEFDELFKKAQKPWAKQYAKVDKAKKEYFLSCKNKKSAEIQENNAKSDAAVSADQKAKLTDKVERLRKEVDANRQKYQHALDELNHVNPKYMEDMTDAFSRCQDFEEKRLSFFKDSLTELSSVLNISADLRLPQLYRDLHLTIGNADAGKDLKWWAKNNGTEMAMNWPQFEEYSEELKSITKKSKKGVGADAGDTVMLTSIQPASQDTRSNDNWSTASRPNSEYRSVAAPVSASSNDPNPFGDDFDEDNYDSVEGVAVRALYNYDGQEDDELTFKESDVFYKIEEEDEQGWCKGRHGDKVGYYPANYVENV